MKNSINSVQCVNIYWNFESIKLYRYCSETTSQSMRCNKPFGEERIQQWVYYLCLFLKFYKYPAVEYDFQQSRYVICLSNIMFKTIMLLGKFGKRVYVSQYIHSYDPNHTISHSPKKTLEYVMFSET